MQPSFLAQAFAHLRPGVDFADVDGTLKNIRIDTPDVTPPTQAEIDYQIALLDCYAKREAAYPPITDMADALAKQATDDGAALAAYQAACMAVKTKYPKP